MMFAYRTPGVYFEHFDTAVLPLRRRTDIAGFVGIATRGPLHQACRVESWSEFVTTFGGHIAQGFLAFAVEGFFANGGVTCYVVRVADPVAARMASRVLKDDRDDPVLRIFASSEGSWGNRLIVGVQRGEGQRFALRVRAQDGAQEYWPDLTMAPQDRRYVEKVIGAYQPQTAPQFSQQEQETGRDTRSLLIRVKDLRPKPRTELGAPNPERSELTVAGGPLFGGKDGLAQLKPEHLSGIGAPPNLCWGLENFSKVDQISMVAIADIMPKPRVQPRFVTPRPRCDLINVTAPTPVPAESVEFPPRFDDKQIAALQYALIGHCELYQDRVAILDPRSTDRTPSQVLNWRNRFASRFAGFYFPWLRVPDPLNLTGLLRDVPPSGHMAGIYARADRETGVHRPPANMPVENAQDVVVSVDDALHGQLNDEAVNVIRFYPGRGLRVAGARTLTGRDDGGWRYVNVRRLLIMIEEHLEEALQWTVFEPNDARLGVNVDRVVRSFLEQLWEAGMLDGATLGEAFTVTCDQSVNPPEEIALGRLNCRIEVQPPYPAEIVVVRIGHTRDGVEFSETRETTNGGDR